MSGPKIEKGWEAGTATRAIARWGCFLPDLTRLASGSSTTNLPASISGKTSLNASLTPER